MCSQEYKLVLLACAACATLAAFGAGVGLLIGTSRRLFVKSIHPASASASVPVPAPAPAPVPAPVPVPVTVAAPEIKQTRRPDPVHGVEQVRLQMPMPMREHVQEKQEQEPVQRRGRLRHRRLRHGLVLPPRVVDHLAFCAQSASSFGSLQRFRCFQVDAAELWYKAKARTTLNEHAHAKALDSVLQWDSSEWKLPGGSRSKG